MSEALLEQSWSFWAGGLAIGAFVILLAGITGKALGVSSGYGSLCAMLSGLDFFRKPPFTDSWRMWFVAGIPLGGFVSAWLAGDLSLKHQMGLFESVFGASLWAKALVLIPGGFLIGYGARWAGG